MSKRTPGKWTRSIWGTVPVFSGTHKGCYIQKGNDELIAFVTANDAETGKANACLIEAAPRLLKALEDLLAVTYGNAPERDEAYAAIKKAKGE